MRWASWRSGTIRRLSDIRVQFSVERPPAIQYHTNMQMPNENTMYQALVRRDSSYDGIFLVAVKTTGIFCRPTCPARKPQRVNVEFFATAQQALLAGYRPCKRCTPMDLHRRPPTWVRSILEQVDSDPAQRLTDADVRALGIEPARVRRYFKEHYGMTFHAYHRARRMGLALAAVRDGAGPERDRIAARV